MVSILLFAFVAVYLVIGWIVLGILDRQHLLERGDYAPFALLFWPFALLIDVLDDIEGLVRRRRR